MSIEESHELLLDYIESEGFKGYDPYDTLLGWFPFHKFGAKAEVLAIQFQKRNPLNIRPLLGIKKDFNPKGMGLLLDAYSRMFSITEIEDYRKKSDFLFDWLVNNTSQGFSGACWGYNFSWASPEKRIDPFTPSSVVTGFIAKGIYQYFLATKNPKAKEILESSLQFILKDLPVYSDNSGSCISYTPVKQDICYNASLLAGGVIAINYALTGDEELKSKATELVDFVVERQLESGAWNYSYSKETGKERVQIDFHQGYVIDSIRNISSLLQINNPRWQASVKRGLEYYKEEQFYPSGRSLWRVPKRWPVEIHNQSQGIITFIQSSDINPEYGRFARTIASWTIQKMQSRRGHFYYHLNPLLNHRISYMRWSQAWMLLALTHILQKKTA